jgi:hypothetical protein
MTQNFYAGQRWYANFGNGFMVDTVVRIVDNFRVELAGKGVVQKSWLNSYWTDISNLQP